MHTHLTLQLRSTSESAYSASEHLFSEANFVQKAALKEQLMGNIAKKTDNRKGKQTVSSLGAEEV